MGNSNGTLAEYWDAIESTPGLQGGFIWEFWDHGLVQTLPDGRTHWAYGGDFGDQPNDGNFVCDGMVWPDRRPKPAMWEHKRARRPGPHRRLAADLAGGRVEVANHQHFTDLGWLRARVQPDRRWRRDRRRRRSTCRRSGPGERATVALPGWVTPGWRDRRGVPDRARHHGRRDGVGAGRVRGLRPPARRLGRDARADRRRQPRRPRRSAPSRSTTTAASSIRSSPRRRRSRCGAPRPTTTGSAGWPRAGASGGVDRLERRLGRRRARRRDDHGPRHVRRRPRRGIVDPARGHLHGPRRRRDRRRRDRRHPRRARRPGRESARSSRSCPGPRACAGSAPARTRPTRIASGPGSSAAGRRPSTDQYVPYIRPQENGGHADVRWLELGDDGPARPPDRPRRRRARSPSPTTAPPTSRPRPTTSTSSRRRDGRPPRCRPSRSGHRQLRPGHAARVPARARPVPAGAGPCATSRRD